MKTKDAQKDLPMGLTISRVHCGGEDNYIEVRIHDNISCIDFITVKVPLSGFADCITGLGHVPCIGEVLEVDKVGTKMETDKLEFEMPKGERYGDDRKKVAVKIAEKQCPKGWVSDNYFGSQGSFFKRDGKEWAQTTICRWVPATEEDLENAKR